MEIVYTYKTARGNLWEICATIGGDCNYTLLYNGAEYKAGICCELSAHIALQCAMMRGIK